LSLYLAKFSFSVNGVKTNILSSINHILEWVIFLLCFWHLVSC